MRAMNSSLPRLCLVVFLGIFSLLSMNGQEPAELPASGGGSSGLSTTSVGPSRFVAAHGRRALVSGYADGGLDVWAYPFHVLRNYRVSFRESGATSEVPGEAIVSRVDYEPGWVERVYLGPDFVVQERLFVPLDTPGAILSYSVESGRPVEISVHATPVLNLMWPGALGGQDTRWEDSLNAYVLSEPLDGYSAVVGSPEIADHDPMVNRAMQGGDGTELGFTLRPRADGSANVFLILNPPKTADVGAAYTQLIQQRDALAAQSQSHTHDLQEKLLQLETPDARVNQAFAAAETALDQAWVCNSDLGCGYVAGYGPTRANRRPQYAWFFAGDGLLSAGGALADGDWTHAREELTFILRYQDRKSGMIWHEMSQSAALIDWQNKYPYMFVHVDTTFQFLGAVAEYVRATGDEAFAREHWGQLASAYRYCASLIDPQTGLPRIPAEKEGANEQEREQDDLGLSVSWVEAASGFARLAHAAGHSDQEQAAVEAERKARAAIPPRYWDAQQQFWISGHTVGGQAMTALRSGPTEAIELRLFGEAETEQLLDRLASSSFQTGWGTRGVGLGSSGFDPQSYASGSVWPVATGSMAETFWRAHRPVTALAVWQSMVQLSFLDSQGHIPEALAGTIYRPQAESVPEQSWSSAAFVSATVHGLLGLDFDASARRLVFTPHLPADWPSVTLQQVRLADGKAAFRLHRNADGLSLSIDNEGSAFELEFSPEMPLGAAYKGASFDGHPAASKVESWAQETSVRIDLKVPRGHSELRVQFGGGVSVVQEIPRVKLGKPDSEPHVVGIHLDSTGALTLDMDVPAAGRSHLVLETPWKVTSAEGATVRSLGDSRLEVSFRPAVEGEPAKAYVRVHAKLRMSRPSAKEGTGP